jgi:hypothetical protein
LNASPVVANRSVSLTIIGLAAQSAGRQPKNNCGLDKTRQTWGRRPELGGKSRLDLMGILRVTNKKAGF